MIISQTPSWCLLVGKKMIVYVKFNHARRKEYQLVTTIEKEGSKLYTYKKSFSKESDKFLLSLLDKYKSLASKKLPFEVSMPLKTENGIRFDYVEGISLDVLLFKSLLAKDKEAIKKIFIGFKDLISKIPLSRSRQNKLFEEHFGKLKKLDQGNSFVGCIDLILENIIVDKNENFIFIDYEWTYPFPVPLKYIFFRSVINAYYKYSPYNIGKLVPIKEVLHIFNITPQEERTYLKYEYKFQGTANQESTMIDFELYLKKYKKIGVRENVSFFDQKQAEVNAFNQKIRRLEEEIMILNKTIGEKENELTSVKSSRVWKLRKHLVKFKKFKR